MKERQFFKFFIGVQNLTSLVWFSVFVSIGVFFCLWRMGDFRPHPIWAALSIASTTAFVGTLAIATFWRVIRGPCRLRVVGWLLVGITPLVWIGVYIAQLFIAAYIKAPVELNIPVRVTATWLSSVLDLEVRWRYPRWTYGEHAVLIDAGQTPNAAQLVAGMDAHICAMAKLLGQPVPKAEFRWIRGSLLGQNRRALLVWALCENKDNLGELTSLDRHENAHTLITLLAGRDQYPPKLLAEGWAESQSKDRARQIGYLAEKQKNGHAYSLQDLVGPEWYGKTSGPVYWQGGPLAHYLMEHYSAETFYKLYSGVRPATFHTDCQAILGDSWETVETEFWAWIDSESKLVAKANSEQPAKPTTEKVTEEKIEFAASVEPADWQAFAEGYQEANQDAKSLPTKLTFLVELDRKIEYKKLDFSDQLGQFEFRAIFDGEDFWIYENLSMSHNRFLLATKERCADLWQDKYGAMEGWVKDHQAFSDIHSQALQLMRIYCYSNDPGNLFPLGSKAMPPKKWTITKLIRPEDGSKEPWSISFTWQTKDDSANPEYHMVVHPALGWKITRKSGHQQGEWKSESDTQYQLLGGLLLPLKQKSLYSRSYNEVHTESRIRLLTEIEQIELKQRVERTVSAGPSDPYERLQQLFLALVIACPLVGVTLLAFSPRSVTAEHTP